MNENQMLFFVLQTWQIFTNQIVLFIKCDEKLKTMSVGTSSSGFLVWY